MPDKNSLSSALSGWIDPAAPAGPGFSMAPDGGGGGGGGGGGTDLRQAEPVSKSSKAMAKAEPRNFITGMSSF
jgi:hypothetical protein